MNGSMKLAGVRAGVVMMMVCAGGVPVGVAAPREVVGVGVGVLGVVDGGADVVKACRDACANVQAVSYSAKTYGTGESKGKVPAYMATVSLARVDGGGWKVYVKGKADAADAVPFEIGYDGVDARSVREKDKVVVEKAVDTMGDLAVFMSTQSARHPIAWELLGETVLAGDESKAVLEGQVDVGMTTCDVVWMPGATDDAPGGVRVAIGVADRLPRRIERLQAPAKESEKPASGRVLELEDLKVNEASVAGYYSPSVPTGYRVKAAESNKPKRKAAPEPEVGGLLAEGTVAPEWSLKDPEGKVHSLSGLKGKVVLLDFWATWCGPCKAAMPSVQKLHEKFKGKVEVFGVNFAESGNPAEYMEKKGFTYTLLLKAEQVAQDYKVTGIPCFYLIGADGKVLYASAGFSPMAEKTLEEKINAALGK
jgi:thiol-disulfide isomerase/thioredoxin